MSAAFPPPQGDPVTTSATAATPAPRFLLPSARLLRITRVIAAFGCLIAGAVGAWVLMTSSGSLTDIDRGNQQILRLQEIKGDVLQADGVAASALAQNRPTTADFVASLKQASALTVAASQAQAADQADLASVSGGLLNYALTMQKGVTLYSSNTTSGVASITEAGTVLNTELIPAIDKVIAANQARVDAAKASDPLWVVGLALVPVLVLLGVSVWLARRTKRVLNIGLLLALASSVVLWQLVSLNLEAARGLASTARDGSLRTATQAADAYTALTVAKSIEGRELLAPTTVGAQEAQFTAAIEKAKAAASSLPGDGTSRISDYVTAHTALAAQLKAGKIADAKASASNATTGVTPAYAKASGLFSETFDTARTTLAADVAHQEGNLRTASILAGLLGLFGFLAAWVGISQRLREYR